MEATTATLTLLPTLTPMAMLLPTPSVATPTFGRGRLRPSLAMATDVEATVAMDVADTARGRLSPAMVMVAGAVMEATDVAMARGLLMLSLRPMLLSSMEATTATLLPSLMPLPTLTPMAMLLPTPSVSTPTSGRGRPMPSPAMAAEVVMEATDVATARGRLSQAMATAAGAVMAAGTTVEL